MKKILIVLSIICLTSCAKKKEEVSVQSANKATVSTEIPGKFISIQQANEEIGSYLKSMDYPNNDTGVRGFLLNADTLRRLIANDEVKGVLAILCHDSEYVQNNYGHPTTTHMSLVLVGLNSNNQIINTQVMNFSHPCPPHCSTDDSGLIPE